MSFLSKKVNVKDTASLVEIDIGAPYNKSYKLLSV